MISGGAPLSDDATHARSRCAFGARRELRAGTSTARSSRGILRGMTAAKIAISLPEPLVAHARNEVRQGRAASVSAYVASAVAKQAESDDLTAMLDAMLMASGGPMTRRERAWADGVLGLKGRRKR